MVLIGTLRVGSVTSFEFIHTTIEFCLYCQTCEVEGVTVGTVPPYDVKKT